MKTTVSLMPAAVVVIAHGPTGSTLTALNRAAGLVAEGGRVVVIAGTAPGSTAVERAAERGFVVAADHGPTALAQLLLSCEGPVLVMHDDVNVSAHSVAGMVLAHCRTGISAVSGNARESAQKGVDHAELCCVVGDPMALARLAQASAFGPGHTSSAQFVVAGDTEMVHLGDCRSRLEDERTDDGDLLVAALIVRDEAELLPACLASLDGVVDRIEVADTGSMDDTVEIARAHGANVIELEWREDIAWARNQVLERCRNAAYMLWIDADERLRCEDPKRLRQTLATFERLYPSYRLEIRNVADGIETHRFGAVRMMHPRGTEFAGAIHEQPRRVDGSELLAVGLTQCHLEHLGYGLDVVDERDKNNRNLRIARESFENDRTAERAIHYARSLVAASDDPEATLTELGPLLAFVADAPDPVQAMVLGLHAKVLLEAEDPVAAEAAARRAVELVPADAIAGAALAEALVRQCRVAEAIDISQELVTRPSPTPVIVDHVAARTRARLVFEAALAESRLDDAVAQLDHLRDDLDPWPHVADRFGTDALADLAAQAGAANDDRLLAALALRHDVDIAVLAQAQHEFLTAGGTLVDTDDVDDVLTELVQVAEAPALRATFAETQSVADAVAYARALAVGHVDLTVELDTARTHEHGAALALGLAAEALRRRGRGDEAAAEAIDAAQRWPGAVRAAVIVADKAIEAGMPEVALDMATAARASGGVDSAPMARRHELVNRVVDARLLLGNLAGAVSEALVIVEEQGSVDAWPAMLEAAVDDTEQLTLLLGLALLSDGSDFLRAAASTLRLDKTAELSLAYLMAGGRNPDAVTTGVLAAVLRDRADLALLLVEHADLLEPDAREPLVEQLRGAGAMAAAERLEQRNALAFS